MMLANDRYDRAGANTKAR